MESMTLLKSAKPAAKSSRLLGCAGAAGGAAKLERRGCKSARGLWYTRRGDLGCWSPDPRLLLLRARGGLWLRLKAGERGRGSRLWAEMPLRVGECCRGGRLPLMMAGLAPNGEGLGDTAAAAAAADRFVGGSSAASVSGMDEMDVR